MCVLWVSVRAMPSACHRKMMGRSWRLSFQFVGSFAFLYIRQNTCFQRTPTHLCFCFCFLFNSQSWIGETKHMEYRCWTRGVGSFQLIVSASFCLTISHVAPTTLFINRHSYCHAHLYSYILCSHNIMVCVCRYNALIITIHFSFVSLFCLFV